MKAHNALIANGGAGVYASLLIVSGLTLMFSMPWASRLSELIAHPWRPAPLAFFLTYTILSMIVALNRGGSVVPTGILRARAMLSMALQVLFGQLLMLPYLAYSRVLFHSGSIAVLIAALYVTVVSLVLGLAGILLEVGISSRGRSSSLGRFGLLIALAGLPLLGLTGRTGVGRWIALISPVEAIRRILELSSSTELAVGFAIQTALGIVLCVAFLRACGRRLHD